MLFYMSLCLKWWKKAKCVKSDISTHNISVIKLQLKFDIQQAMSQKKLETAREKTMALTVHQTELKLTGRLWHLATLKWQPCSLLCALSCCRCWFLCRSEACYCCTNKSDFFFFSSCFFSSGPGADRAGRVGCWERPAVSELSCSHSHWPWTGHLHSSDGLGREKAAIH